MTILVALMVLMGLAVLSSTKEDRDEAERRLKRYNPFFAVITLTIVGLFVWSFM